MCQDIETQSFPSGVICAPSTLGPSREQPHEGGQGAASCPTAVFGGIDLWIVVWRSSTSQNAGHNLGTSSRRPRRLLTWTLTGFMAKVGPPPLTPIS
jgi:hypothetical protein